MSSSTDLLAAAQADAAATAESNGSPLASAKRRIAAAEANGVTASVLDRQDVAAADGAAAGAVGRLRTLAADVVGTVAALEATGAAVPPNAHRLRCPMCRPEGSGQTRSGGECRTCTGSGVLDAREVLAAADAAAAARRIKANEEAKKLAAKLRPTNPALADRIAARKSTAGLIGRYSAADADRWTLADLRRVIRREAGPLARLATSHGSPLDSDEYAEMTAHTVCGIIAAAPDRPVRCRACCTYSPARWSATLDSGTPGVEATVPLCDRHAARLTKVRTVDGERVDGQATPILPDAAPRAARIGSAALATLAHTVAQRWFRERAARRAATSVADSEAAEGTPARAAATLMDLVAADDVTAEIGGTALYLAAVERAAGKLDLKVSTAERWALRWGVTLTRVSYGKRAGQLAPSVSSADLAAVYGASESAVRVGAMRGAARLADTLDLEAVSEWGRATGKVLAAVGALPPAAIVLRDGTAVGTAADGMRQSIARNRAVALDWPMRLPQIKRDRATRRYVYADAPNPPSGAGWRASWSLTASIADPLPPRVLARCTCQTSHPDDPSPCPYCDGPTTRYRWSEGFAAPLVPLASLWTHTARDRRACPQAPYADPQTRDWTHLPRDRWTRDLAPTVSDRIKSAATLKTQIKGVGKPLAAPLTATARATVAQRAGQWADRCAALNLAAAQRDAARYGRTYNAENGHSHD